MKISYGILKLSTVLLSTVPSEGEFKRFDTELDAKCFLANSPYFEEGEYIIIPLYRKEQYESIWDGKGQMGGI